MKNNFLFRIILFLSFSLIFITNFSCSFLKTKNGPADFVDLKIPLTTPDDVCYDIIAEKNEIWIACALKRPGVIHYNGNKWDLQVFIGPEMYGTHFAHDKNGNLFLVGKNAMYAEYQNGKWISARSTPLKTGTIGDKDYYDFSDFFDVKSYEDGFLAVSVGYEIRLARFNKIGWDFWDLTESGLGRFPLRIFVDGENLAVSSSGRIAFYQDKKWTSQDIPFRQGWIFDLEGISLNDLWVAGYRNRLFGKEDVLFRFDGKSFVRHRLPSEQPVYGLHVESKDEVYAVGHSGSVNHWNGKDWKSFNSGVATSLYAIRKSSDGFLYVVGDRGVILKSKNKF